MRRLVCLLVSILCVTSCSSEDDFTPTEPSGPSIPTIGGTYSSASMWRFDLDSSTGLRTLNCAGGVTITTQVGTTFSGTFFVNDPACGSLSGSVTNGVLNGTAVTFELSVGGVDFITAAFGCTYVSGDRGLTGTLVGNQLQAQQRTVMNCTQGGEVTLQMQLSGTR